MDPLRQRYDAAAEEIQQAVSRNSGSFWRFWAILSLRAKVRYLICIGSRENMATPQYGQMLQALEKRGHRDEGTEPSTCFPIMH